MVNLEQDFIKFETNGELAYYGYANNLSTSDSDNNWSIRLMTGTGSTFDIKWANNDKLNFISKWSEKESYFQDPNTLYSSWEDTGVTYSVSNLNETKYVLNVEWDEIPGVDYFNIKIKNEKGNLVNNNNVEIYNIYSSINTESFINKLKYKFYGLIGKTYSFEISAFNSYGKLTKSFNFPN